MTGAEGIKALLDGWKRDSRRPEARLQGFDLPVLELVDS
jgi:hypothetical protein